VSRNLELKSLGPTDENLLLGGIDLRDTDGGLVNTGVKVHQRIAVKIHQPEEDGSGVWPLEGGARGGLPPRRVIEDLI
jgi:hypothetical protein